VVLLVVVALVVVALVVVTVGFSPGCRSALVAERV